MSKWLSFFLPGLALVSTVTASAQVEFSLSNKEKAYIITTADAYLDSIPYSVTHDVCERSAGGPHDFYSEGDYWWPDPDNPDGPYIRRDGFSNPENFAAHRIAMMRLSTIVGMLTSAYILTSSEKYVHKVEAHLATWFVDPETRMNPHMLYAQAIKGRVTGRGIGIIDTIHLVEVARAVKILQNDPRLSKDVLLGTKQWFRDFLLWISTHPYGIEERDWHNNHATCWAMQAAAFADLVGDTEMLEFCKKRFKEVLLPDLMATDGSFPHELGRTKPYAYSLFHLDAMATLCQILSSREDNLWEYEAEDGKSLRKGVSFIFPYIVDKSKWPYKQDVMYWDDWPFRHPSLLFAAQAYDNEEYLETWKDLEAYPEKREVLRGFPVRHPLLWLEEAK